MPKIPEISVRNQMERSVSVLPTGLLVITSGGGPLLSVGPIRPKFAVPFFTNRFIALLHFTYEGNRNEIPLGWPGLTRKCRSIFLGYSHWSLTCNKYHIRALCPFLDFLGGNLSDLAKRDSALAARKSGSRARKIASPRSDSTSRRKSSLKFVISSSAPLKLLS